MTGHRPSPRLSANLIVLNEIDFIDAYLEEHAPVRRRGNLVRDHSLLPPEDANERADMRNVRWDRDHVRTVVFDGRHPAAASGLPASGLHPE